MVSGKYSALAGAISREQAIANISQNLANVSTVGYKKSMVSFESILRGEKQQLDAKGINYSRVRENFSDFSAGPKSSTGNPLDVSIQGEGFFKIQGLNGQLYTKSGNFKLDSAGKLVTQSGLSVLNDGNAEITLSNFDLKKIVIDTEGTISTISNDGAASEVGKIGIFNVDNLLNLQRVSDTMFLLKEGGVEIPNDQPTVTQGSVEISNVNMTEEISRMINSNRTFQTYTKVLESYKTLGEAQDKLGTIS